MKILKFSNTILTSSKDIVKVVNIVKYKASQENIIIVTSAFDNMKQNLKEVKQLVSRSDKAYIDKIKEIEKHLYGIVDELIPITEQSEIKGHIKILINELDDFCQGIFLVSEVTIKAYHYLLSFGETISTYLLHKILQQNDIDVKLVDAKQLIETNDNFGKVSINFPATTRKVKKVLDIKRNIILSGSIASTPDNYTIRLGKGGDEYTASTIANILKIDTLEMWSNKEGIMTSNKDLVPHAYPIPKLSYEEALELLHFGEKVLYPPSIHSIVGTNTKINIRNINEPEKTGTLIIKEVVSTPQIIKGISSVGNIALITVSGSGMIGIHGIAQRLFNSLAINKINVIFITQSSSEHTITIGITQQNLKKATTAIENEFVTEIKQKRIDKVLKEQYLSVIALVGDTMKEHIGLCGQIFQALGKNGINIRGIAQGSTERNISIVISNKDEKKALNTLHESLFLSETRQAHLFLIGVGNVGGTLINQLKEQQQYIKDIHHIEPKISAIANSKKMLFNAEGVDLANWEQELEKKGKPMDLDFYTRKMKKLNLRNSIFVDNTASEEISQIYSKVLSESISIATSNKIAAASDYENYAHLKQLAKDHSAQYNYETNVGAGLPIIKTINDLILSGDEILKIEAILSGSLNFIFNTFSKETSFYNAVKQAREEGYTEPDPRIDLSGIDVMRKILILARETGATLNIEEVKNERFLPSGCIDTQSIEEFMQELQKNAQHFDELRLEAEKENKKLKFVAQYDGKGAKVGLQAVGDDHPFYNLAGKDNIVLLTTKRYQDQPMVVQGAGAGAEVTASGVFTDIIRAINE